MQNPMAFIDFWGLSPTAEEAALMAQHIYEFNRFSPIVLELGGIPIADRMVSAETGRTWVLNAIWSEGTVVMGIYGLVGSYYYGVEPLELAVVFQGTNRAEDWPDNFLATLTTFAPNLRTARAFAHGVVYHNPGLEITFVGHSKGGGEAIAAALATGRNAITFNAANFNHHPAFVYVGLNLLGANIRNYYVRYELLQFLTTAETIGGNPIWLDPPLHIMFTNRWGVISIDRYRLHGIEAVIESLRAR